jgi:pseudouridylate synthase
MMQLPKHFVVAQEISKAQKLRLPMVALESTVITHGLPRPDNLELARDMEKHVRENQAVPATIAVLRGKIHVGLSSSDLEALSNMDTTRKISLRDFGIALADDLSGGTTVAGTLFAADAVGIRVFATGGIGGVHRGAPFDVSADLPMLGKSRVVVVCGGAKAILDLPATLEYLETQGVPVIGYQTDELPAFYTRSSGLSVDQKAKDPEHVAKIASKHWEAGLKTAILLVVPPPEESALEQKLMEAAIADALADADSLGIHGAATTPYLLKRVSELTGGDSLRANLDLLKNNARVAAKVAVAMRGLEGVPAF